MRYMLTIYDDREAWEHAPREDIDAMMQGYRRFNEEVAEAGVYVAGQGLQPARTATTVRVQGGERVITDGPFAETKEELGGFYLLECGDLDEAIEWAAKLPGAQSGCVEVRPVLNTGS